MPEKTKLPQRPVVGDDLVIEVDGQEYRPHAGETVTFKPGKQSSADYLLQMRFQALQQEIAQAATVGKLNTAQIDQVETLANEALVRFLARIESWDWTAKDGSSLPLTLESLKSLEAEELQWLRQKADETKTEQQQRDSS